MLDGRHTGTGGGNHLSWACNPEDSPFLRRPDLLASLVAIGTITFAFVFILRALHWPDIAGPRVDEARNDSLNELEIAFASCRHRARSVRHGSSIVCSQSPDRRDRQYASCGFCIDKLFPGRSTGRLGLLELRAFEMPPHERMSLTQQLLLRSPWAALEDTVRAGASCALGTGLHDRSCCRTSSPRILRRHCGAGCCSFCAPRRVVCAAFGISLSQYGDFTARGVEVELRQALEPWHVMGRRVQPARPPATSILA